VTNGHLAPQHDDDMELLVPTPQDWGLPEKPTLQQRDCWEHQQRFLRRYAERGKLALSAGDVGISVSAVEKWQRLDKYSFNKRLEQAYQAYRETQEELNEEWVRETKHNSQIYRIFHMKAIWPEKYRDDVKPVDTSDSKRLLDMLTEMAARDIEKRRLLEEGSVNGEYRELPEEERGK
jgi:hypothetical protein